MKAYFRRERFGLSGGFADFKLTSRPNSQLPTGERQGLAGNREARAVEVRRDEPELAEQLRIEERELEAGGLN